MQRWPKSESLRKLVENKMFLQELQLKIFAVTRKIIDWRALATKAAEVLNFALAHVALQFELHISAQ